MQVFEAGDRATGVDVLVPLYQAMRHAVHGGKGMRGFLVMESARLFQIDPNQSVFPAAAIEALHAYSLVHDDLPCMDDDDMRRGQPTVHRKWDEATAVLVGDALQSLAFELITRADTSPNPAIRADLVLILARAAGARGIGVSWGYHAAQTLTAARVIDRFDELPVAVDDVLESGS